MATEMKIKLSNLKVDNTIEGNILNDSNGNNIVETYFPKSGGELNNKSIKRNIDDSSLALYGGTGYGHGANLVLFGKDDIEHAGSVYIEVLNKENSSHSYLNIKHNDLTWNGNSLAGSAIVAKSLNTNGYVKYASGLIIQWGRNEDTTSTKVTVTLNTAFNSVNYTTMVNICNDSDSVKKSSVYAKYTNRFFVIKDTITDVFDWLAIGY